MQTMRRGLITLAVALAMPAFAHAQGSTIEVETGDSFFEPEAVATDAGVESVRWAWSTETAHNVVEQNGIFDSGSPSTTGDFTITPSAGTFKYLCTLHGVISSGKPLGMAGEVAVKPTATPQGKQALVTWATESTDTGSRFDVRQKAGKKKAKVVEERTKAIEGAFKLKPGTKYAFEVRSYAGKKPSDWSPKLKIKG
jgi:plastocyanin